MPRPTLVLRPVRTSCVLIECDGLALLTDPFFGDRMSGRKVKRRPAIALSSLPPLDLVIASHLHTDHFDRAAVAQLCATNPELVIVGTRGTSAFCADMAGAKVLDMAPWTEATVAGVGLMATPAQHTGPPPAEVNFVLDVRGWRLFFGGDARLSQHTEAIGQRCPQLDVALLPVGGSEIWMKRTTMNPQDAVEACRLLRPRLALGIHEGGEWPAMPPLSRHPGRRADFDRLLTAAALATQPLPVAPGGRVQVEDSGDPAAPLRWELGGA